MVSTSRTTQADGYRPGLVGPGLVINTYNFPIGKMVVRGEERSAVKTLGIALCGRPAVELSLESIRLLSTRLLR